MKAKAIGFIAIKEGEGDEVIYSPEGSDKNPRTFFYWKTEAFKEELASTGYSVISEGFRPVSQRTKWLTYHVQVA